MRRLIHRHQKTDRLDALALAKLPYVDPDHVHQAILPPDSDWQALKRGVKREHKLADRIGQTRQALEELAEEILPGLSKLFPEASRTQNHWHVDETRWLVFAETQGKTG